MITLFKIINGKYKEFFNKFFVFTQINYNLRGNDKKIKCKYNFNNSQWQFYFSEEQYICGVSYRRMWFHVGGGTFSIKSIKKRFK